MNWRPTLPLQRRHKCGQRRRVTAPVIRMRASAANSIWIVPLVPEGALNVADLAQWRLPQNGPRHPAAALAQTRKRGRPRGGQDYVSSASTSRPSRARRRHVNNWLADTRFAAPSPTQAGARYSSPPRSGPSLPTSNGAVTISGRAETSYREIMNMPRRALTGMRSELDQMSVFVAVRATHTLRRRGQHASGTQDPQTGGKILTLSRLGPATDSC